MTAVNQQSEEQKIETIRKVSGLGPPRNKVSADDISGLAQPPRDHEVPGETGRGDKRREGTGREESGQRESNGENRRGREGRGAPRAEERKGFTRSPQPAWMFFQFQPTWAYQFLPVEGDVTFVPEEA